MGQNCLLVHRLALFFRHLTPLFLKPLWPLKYLPRHFQPHMCTVHPAHTLLMFGLAKANRVGGVRSPWGPFLDVHPAYMSSPDGDILDGDILFRL